MERLFSSVVAALRSYQELVELKQKGDQERERVELLKSKVAEVRKVLLESSGQTPSSATPDISIPEDERIKKISAFVASHLGKFFPTIGGSHYFENVSQSVQQIFQTDNRNHLYQFCETAQE